MDMLEDKIVLITGAGSGIGKQATKVCVREGATVVAVDFSGAEKATAAEFGEKVLPVHCDVAKDEEVAALFETVRARFGRVDAVMNVAGTHGGPRPPETVTVTEFERMTAVNLRGVLLITQNALPLMLANGGGAFVNVSSISSVNVERHTSFMYAAAKSGVNTLTKYVAVEYGRQGIRANAIAPGFTFTEFMGEETPLLREMGQKAAIGRAGTPLELAEVAAFLISDRAAFVSGVVLPVDGGWSAQLV
jgi:NAD(P)-dependent dehydrogenase (short-subunit alcohol dehydrogenase family)